MTDAELFDLIEGARSWGPRQVRIYNEKAHRMINALADELEKRIPEEQVESK